MSGTLIERADALCWAGKKGENDMFIYHDLDLS